MPGHLGRGRRRLHARRPREDPPGRRYADGELWGQTLWDLRQGLVASLGDSPGRTRARALVTEAMRLSGPNPSMLDQRDAIVAADQSLFAAADVPAIWNAFRGRGMGYFAATLGPNDTAPVEDGAAPVDCTQTTCGTLSGKVLNDETGAGIAGAAVQLLGPPGLSAVSAGDGSYAIPNVPPHTYPYLEVSAAGFTPLAYERHCASWRAPTRHPPRPDHARHRLDDLAAAPSRRTNKRGSHDLGPPSPRSPPPSARARARDRPDAQCFEGGGPPRARPDRAPARPQAAPNHEATGRRWPSAARRGPS